MIIPPDFWSQIENFTVCSPVIGSPSLINRPWWLTDGGTANAAAHHTIKPTATNHPAARGPNCLEDGTDVVPVELSWKSLRMVSTCVVIEKLMLSNG
jgi:hypothetical protein